METYRCYVFLLTVAVISAHTKAQDTHSKAAHNEEISLSFPSKNDTLDRRPTSSEMLFSSEFVYDEVTEEMPTRIGFATENTELQPGSHLKEEVIQVSFIPSTLSIPEEQVEKLTINLTCIACRNLDIAVTAAVVNKYLAAVSPPSINMTYTGNDNYEAVFNITTVFLGRTSILISFSYYNTTAMMVDNFHEISLPLSVERVRRFIDELFDIMMQVFLVVSTATFGCELDLNMMKGYFKRPVGACIGLFCQYGIMPSVSEVCIIPSVSL